MEWLTSFLDDSKQKLSDILSIPKDTKAFGIGLANAKSSVGGALGRGVQLLNQGNEGLLSEVNARPTPTTSKGFSTNFAGGPIPKVNAPNIPEPSKGSVASEGTKVSEGTKAFDGTKEGTAAGLGAVANITAGLASLKKQKEATPSTSPGEGAKANKFDFYIPEEWL